MPETLRRAEDRERATASTTTDTDGQTAET
jgi:hypothetical protein